MAGGGNSDVTAGEGLCVALGVGVGSAFCVGDKVIAGTVGSSACHGAEGAAGEGDGSLFALQEQSIAPIRDIAMIMTALRHIVSIGVCFFIV